MRATLKPSHNVLQASYYIQSIHLCLLYLALHINTYVCSAHVKLNFLNLCHTKRAHSGGKCKVAQKRTE